MGTRQINVILLAIACSLAVAFPLALQYHLWRTKTDEGSAFERFHRGFAEVNRADLLLIGDSSLTHIRVPNERSLAGITVAGFGGTGAETWRYMLERALDHGLKPRKVAFVTVSTGNILGLDSFPAILPHMMGPEGILRSWRSGEIGSKPALRLLRYCLMPFARGNELLLHEWLNPRYPALAEWLVRSKKLEMRGSLWPGADPRPLRELLELGKARGLELHFVLSPVTKAMREDENYRHQERFAGICLTHALTCHDASAALPDSAFADAIHVSSGESERLLRVIADAVGAR